MKTADQIEEMNAQKDVSQNEMSHAESSENSAPVKKRIIGRPFPKGVSGNPGGKPKNDVAKEIAQLVFTENREAIYVAMTNGLLKGNAYVFKELAERAFGKLKENKEIKHVYDDVDDGTLQERLDRVLGELGVIAQVDACGGSARDTAHTSKANGKAQDSELLPR